jgi:hypothetical protein
MEERSIHAKLADETKKDDPMIKPKTQLLSKRRP